MTKVDPIDQAVRDAKKALRQAETVQRNRKKQMRDAGYYLEKIAEFRIDVSSEDIELLGKAATRQGWIELGFESVKKLLDPIGKTVNAMDAAKFAEWFRNPHRETTSSSEFTPEERLLILASLHPDNSASEERREAAFKAFNKKVKTRRRGLTNSKEK